MKNSIDLVRQLVNDFKTHEATYLAPDYQEQEARKDFIDKFLISLGWDVNHERQKNPYEQEVKIEQSVKTGRSQRRADYAFFIGPNFRDPKFFVEAKKPSRSLSNPDDYYQIIRYAYNKKIPISVLTDFEEFHIIDCRFMPDIKTALSRKIDYFHYSDYADEEKFSRIFHLFGREAVEKGSIEKYAAELPKPKGKGAQQASFKGGFLSIDEAFLEKLDDFRLTLAKSFKKHNQELESEELTEAVQRTIDRLVFIRFLEDKNIEERHIENLTQNLTPSLSFQRRGSQGEVGESAWKSFVNLCRSLEPKYNGLVFKHHALIDGDKFVPPEEEFAEICSELADPSSPYLFDEIPISILGSIYERFLGKVVHATPKRADVEDKPEVRKAGGVYYTPEYIVRYIVQNTVGKLLQPPSGSPLEKEGEKLGKTPEEISQMAFADIACGSGSFLIEVYSELLDYHTRYYSAYPEKAKPGDTQMRDGKVVLSLKKRQEILTNNIYGVDIDYQATEVTQLSLYLKLLEDVTMNDAYQYSLLKEKILPDLKQNIVCGNSLIGTDILEGDLFEKTEERKLNPMNFADAFPKVMKRGGFDAIVGNPPYGGLLGHSEDSYFQSKYKFQNYQLDTYYLFLEKGLEVLRKDCLFGMIIPNTWLLNLQSTKIREFVFNEYGIINIVHYQKPVFDQATVDTEVVIIQKMKALENHKIEIKVYDKSNLANDYLILQKRWRDLRGKPVNLFEKPEVVGIADKLRRFEILDNICAITQGAKPFQVGKGKPKQTRKIVDEKPFVSEKKLNSTFKPLLRGSLIGKYQILWNKDYWISLGDWLAEPRYSANYEAPLKIVIRQTGDSLVATLDDKQFIVRDNLYTIVSKLDTINLYFVLGLINSRLLNWFYQNILNPEKGEALAQVKRGHIAELPIRTINFSDTADKSRHDHIVKLVEQMLSAKEKLASAKLESEKDRLELLCASLDRQIDEAVYELYGLTPEEIKIVEGEK